MVRELVYVADPMCSWCYGFAPELETFLESQSLPTRLIMGGLWAGHRAQPLSDELKAYLRDVWTRVGSLSGRHFSFALLERDDWLYDTEPACRAVVTMREMAPGLEMRFMGTLQDAFYSESRDLTDEFVYPDLLAGYPVEIADFMLMFRSAELASVTRGDFEEAQRIGARGFPTLFLRSGDVYTPLTRGYARSQQLTRAFEVLGVS